jgi:hypothetical protein
VDEIRADEATPAGDEDFHSLGTSMLPSRREKNGPQPKTLPYIGTSGRGTFSLTIVDNFV